MLTVKNISFAYQEKIVLENISFQLERGKHLAIMGESGCGKSTLLQMIYGLFDLNEGEILWGNQKITGPKYNLVPGMPFIKYLAQDFDLMPYISVGENVGKYLSNIDYMQKQNRIDELLEVVEMTTYKHEKTKNLSGGQMQRVALAKALAKSPELLLLDEPFSHIDHFRKNGLRRKLFAYIKENNITCITATHDREDVLGFSDELLILKNGKIIEKGNTDHLFKKSQYIYTKQLFDDCNEIEGNQLGLENNEKQLIYPDELEICACSALQVKIIKTYFNGNHFKIVSTNLSNESTIFFNHWENLNPDEIYFLKNKP
ncbi:MAG: ABC transporter ATP-binding protein [Flavobacterium sp.]